MGQDKSASAVSTHIWTQQKSSLPDYRSAERGSLSESEAYHRSVIHVGLASSRHPRPNQEKSQSKWIVGARFAPTKIRGDSQSRARWRLTDCFIFVARFVHCRTALSAESRHYEGRKCAVKQAACRVRMLVNKASYIIILSCSEGRKELASVCIFLQLLSSRAAFSNTVPRV